MRFALSGRTRIVLLAWTTTGLPAATESEYVGSKACAQCHAAVYQRFIRTPMARSLARASPVNTPEFSTPVQFLHPKTGRRYRIFRERADSLVEEFFQNREGATIYSDLRRVAYSIGSGNHARSYLVARPGSLYEAPVTFYTRTGRWDMSPGYDNSDYVGFGRKITTNCLFCHAGRMSGWDSG